MPDDLDQDFIKTITDAIPGMIAYWDRELRCRFANRAYAGWFGREPTELMGRTIQEVAGESFDALNQRYVMRALAGEAQTFQRDITMPDGSVRRTWANYVPDADADGAVRGFFVLVNDVTPLWNAEQRLLESESRYRLLAENGTDMVFELDRDLIRRYVSPACREILGYEPTELIGVKPRNQVHPDDAERVSQTFQSLLDGGQSQGMITNRILHRDGRWVWVEVTLRALRDGERGLPRGIIGSLRDISARKAIEQELEEANRRLEALAGKDALTGLANRRTFDDVLDKEYRRARRERKSLSLIMIDVDHFKAFNDHYGHPEGDECLRRVAAAIQATVRRPGDMVARYGGEEFAVILPSTPESGAATIADLIRDSVLKLRLPHQNIPSQMLTISCGVAATESFDRRPTSLVKLADRALYQAKENGRNRVIQASKLLAIVASKSSASA